MNEITSRTGHDAIFYRADEILLQLLDGLERDIKGGTLPSPHLAAYEALCRAEATRLGA
jgi:hypothetical protein